MITLTKNMETGVAKIDEQHKELVNRINAVTYMGIEANSKEETQKTLNLLEEYIIKHFNDEEALQKDANYPKYKEHKQEHQHLITEFKKLKKEFDLNGLSSNFTFNLNLTLIGWIVKHIKSYDVELGKYLKNKGK